MMNEAIYCGILYPVLRKIPLRIVYIRMRHSRRVWRHNSEGLSTENPPNADGHFQAFYKNLHNSTPFSFSLGTSPFLHRYKQRMNMCNKTWFIVSMLLLGERSPSTVYKLLKRKEDGLWKRGPGFPLPSFTFVGFTRLRLLWVVRLPCHKYPVCV